MLQYKARHPFSYSGQNLRIGHFGDLTIKSKWCEESMLMYTENIVDIFSSSTQSSEDSLLDKEHDQGSVSDTSFQRGGQENRNQEQAQYMQLQCVHSELIAT